MRDAERKEILKWLCRLEEIAVRNHVKTRLLDAIWDCKKDFESGQMQEDWQAKCQELEKIFEQIRKQMPYDPEEEIRAGDTAQRVSEMIEECRRSNETRQKEYIKGSAAYVHEAEKLIKEFTNVQANYDDVTDRRRYLAALDRVGQKYKQEMDAFTGKYVSFVSQNYQNVFDRMKLFFSSADSEKETGRRFYEIYYKNQDVLMRDTQEYASNLEKGESSIHEFAEKIQTSVQQIIKRIRQKAFWKKRLPILLILIAIVLGIVGNIVRQPVTTSVQQEETAEQEEENSLWDSTGEKIMDRFADKMAEFLLTKIVQVLIIGMFICIMIILLYIFWVKSIDKRCRNDIVKETEELLTTAFEEWRQQGTLLACAKESFLLAGTYADKQYGDLILELADEGKEEANAEKEEFIKLCSDWENIKRKVEF